MSKKVDESHTDDDLSGWELTQDECELKLTTPDGQTLFSRGKSETEDTCYTNLQGDCHLLIRDEDGGKRCTCTYGCSSGWNVQRLCVCSVFKFLITISRLSFLLLLF